MFIVLIVGSVIGYQASFDDISGELDDTMKSFVDKSLVPEEKDQGKLAITKAWNQVQEDVSYTFLIFAMEYMRITKSIFILVFLPFLRFFIRFWLYVIFFSRTNSENSS